MVFRAPLVVGALLLAGGVAAVAQTPAPTLPSDKIITTRSGLKYGELREGKGAVAEKGRSVRVLYTGWLEDGTIFDSKIDRNRPFAFTPGAGTVIKGWEEGVIGMRVGGKRLLIIPPSLAYGAKAQRGIPANSELTFVIELIGVSRAPAS